MPPGYTLTTLTGTLEHIGPSPHNCEWTVSLANITPFGDIETTIGLNCVNGYWILSIQFTVPLATPGIGIDGITWTEINEYIKWCALGACPEYKAYTLGNSEGTPVGWGPFPPVIITLG